MAINCPECSSSISLPVDSEVGDIVVCENCGVELEVVNLNPPEVDVLEIEK